MADLLKATEWRKQTFVGNYPCQKTVTKWCSNGTIPARKIGNVWFVIVSNQQEEMTGNPLVDKVLESRATS